jgi:hypothetical protein
VLPGPADMWLIGRGINAIRNTRNTPSTKTEVAEQARSLGLWTLKQRRTPPTPQPHCNNLSSAAPVCFRPPHKDRCLQQLATFVSIMHY